MKRVGDYILRWRRQGRSYRRIQQILREHCHLDVAYETLRRFVQRRENPRTAESAAVETAAVESSSETAAPVMRKPRMSIEERRAQADAIRAQFTKPVSPEKPKDTRPRSEYDPDKPLTLIKKPKE
jgi:hypothetical protein